MDALVSVEAFSYTESGYNWLMTKFYTRTGDDGTTGLLGEGRARKDSPRLEAVGAIDEANAALGIARAACLAPTTPEIILAVQRDLYGLMAEIAATPKNAARFRTITDAKVTWIEGQITVVESQVEPTNEFIVPGDTPAGAALDLARTIVRRAERRVIGLHLEGELENSELQRYLNRLSSLCFVLELLETQQAGTTKPTLAKGEQI
jgi:cob(I)alamin adenosyltransferase